jgi:ATP-dependent RNA helicase RhlE
MSRQGSEGARERGREGGRERGREGGREGEREGGREQVERKSLACNTSSNTSQHLAILLNF